MRWKEWAATLVALMLNSSLGWAQPCTPQNLQGVWQLERAQYRKPSGDVVATIAQGQLQSRKFLLGQQFSFITTQPDGRFEVAAAGVWSVEQSEYLEQVELSSLPRLRAKRYRFECQLEGDLWRHQGEEDGVIIDESWRRIHPLVENMRN